MGHWNCCGEQILSLYIYDLTPLQGLGANGLGIYVGPVLKTLFVGIVPMFELLEIHYWAIKFPIIPC